MDAADPSLALSGYSIGPEEVSQKDEGRRKKNKVSRTKREGQRSTDKDKRGVN
jgi:hypothetical protein